jgi:hypothetical protein
LKDAWQDKSAIERILDGAAEARQDQWEWKQNEVPDDGVQTDQIGIKRLAIVGRISVLG